MSSQTNSTFQLSSSDIAADTTIPSEYVYNGFGCTGPNISPALSWSGAPAETKSFAITMYDPDAPSGSGWWHWIIYNIPTSVTSLPTGAGNSGGPGFPAGARHGMTDFGAALYGGPCPPVGHGVHHYVFTVHALSVATLDVPENATSALIGFVINGNVLGTANFTGLYGR